jgi:hypothetical protein
METATYRPLPPILYRYPGRRFFEKPLPPLPDGSFDIEIELVPKPLFSRPITLPPPGMHFAVVTGQSPVSPLNRPHSTSSRASSLRSSNDSIMSSASTVSRASIVSTAPSSISSYSPSHSRMSTWSDSSTSDLQPRRSLRRRKPPTDESLRSLRAKQSDACLQRMYDEQTSAYLNGTMFTRARARLGLGMAIEE